MDFSGDFVVTWDLDADGGLDMDCNFVGSGLLGDCALLGDCGLELDCTLVLPCVEAGDLGFGGDRVPEGDRVVEVRDVEREVSLTFFFCLVFNAFRPKSFLTVSGGLPSFVNLFVFPRKVADRLGCVVPNVSKYLFHRPLSP